MEEQKIKKIIALSASPSRGRNSDTMLDHFIAGIKDKSQNKIEVEKIYLEDIEIEHYQYENKNGPTEKEIDFANLAKKIEIANGIVIATPTYNLSVPAHLKNFIDRIRFIALDLEKKNIFGQPIGKFKDKKMFFLVSGGTPNLIHFFLFFLFPDLWLKAAFAYFGVWKSKALYTGNIKAFQNKKILKKCFRKGQKFAKSIL